MRLSKIKFNCKEPCSFGARDYRSTTQESLRSTGIADGGHDDIKKAKSSAAEISAANIRENLLKLREKLTGLRN